MNTLRKSKHLGAFLLGWLLAIGAAPANAQCVLPYQLSNGQPADADQVMANFTALLGCINDAAPAGADNSVQYKASAGVLGGIGPLTDGQLVIGDSSGAPQAATLTPGAGVSIVNDAGSVTISATGGAGGLYNQVLSATPTSVGTGLVTWLNQGDALVNDSAVGLSIDAPTTGSSVALRARYMTVPTPPYTFKALVAATRNSSQYSGVGIGWYNGSDKIHVMSYMTKGSYAPIIEVQKWNSATSHNSNDFASYENAFSQPLWFRIGDDGTNVSFAFSQDGSNFLEVFSTPKSTGWLGSSGYANIVFFVVPFGGHSIGTLLSWAEE